MQRTFVENLLHTFVICIFPQNHFHFSLPVLIADKCFMDPRFVFSERSLEEAFGHIEEDVKPRWIQDSVFKVSHPYTILLQIKISAVAAFLKSKMVYGAVWAAHPTSVHHFGYVRTIKNTDSGSVHRFLLGLYDVARLASHSALSPVSFLTLSDKFSLVNPR